MSQNTSIVYANRLCDSDSMTTKLIYQVKKNQLNERELNKLQARCSRELNELRQELNELLQELRAIAEKSSAAKPAASRQAA